LNGNDWSERTYDAVPVAVPVSDAAGEEDVAMLVTTAESFNGTPAFLHWLTKDSWMEGTYSAWTAANLKGQYVMGVEEMRRTRQISLTQLLYDATKPVSPHRHPIS
jgi:hypothetical protein